MNDKNDKTEKGAPRLIQRVVALLASYGLAVVLLVLLMLLTFFGTLEQVDHGIYAVQQKYFNSLFLIHRIGGAVPLPLPGGYLVMAVLGVNLFLGAIVRGRKSWRQPGMLIAHAGVFVLLGGGFVTYHYSYGGNLQLYEGQASDTFQSYHDWVVEVQEVREGAETPVYVVPAGALRRARDERVFVSAALPFQLTLSGYAVNCRPMRASPQAPMSAVEGFYLQTLPREQESEQNVAGVYVDISGGQMAKPLASLLWGRERYPLVFEAGERLWSVQMTRQKWKLPFTVLLDKFKVEMHPNTRMARVFESQITKIEGRSHEKARIYMNHPLRYKGFTLFQASWGPQNAAPGERLFTGLAVVRNPSDHWPLYACIIMSIGMLIHFCQRLARYLREQS